MAAGIAVGAAVLLTLIILAIIFLLIPLLKSRPISMDIYGDEEQPKPKKRKRRRRPFAPPPVLADLYKDQANIFTHHGGGVFFPNRYNPPKEMTGLYQVDSHFKGSPVTVTIPVFNQT
eukprot:XP_002612257.1 hypothetical protein BRAFLDRAFT_100070 [Branchiostoma floridae]